ncbi:MAG TPA: hypothetical protein VNE62_02515 [Actinomycetota bacterium]|nr:hypothetical protein [Actinomycetota bacterium]
MTGNPIDAFGPRTFEVECGGETHRVVWDKGQIIAPDHDQEAEEVLATFGGRREPCLALVALSRMPLPDPSARAIVAGMTGERDLTWSAASLEQTAAQYPGMARAGWFRSTASMLRGLAVLPPEGRDLFWLHSAFRQPPVKDRGKDAEIRLLLTNAVQATAPGSDISVRCEVVRETKTPHAFGLSNGTTSAVAVFVQPSWIAIAREGASVVDGYALLRLNRPTSRRSRRAWALVWQPLDDGLSARVARASVDPSGSVRLLKQAHSR